MSTPHYLLLLNWYSTGTPMPTAIGHPPSDPHQVHVVSYLFLLQLVIPGHFYAHSY